MFTPKHLNTDDTYPLILSLPATVLSIILHCTDPAKTVVIVGNGQRERTHDWHVPAQKLRLHVVPSSALTSQVPSTWAGTCQSCFFFPITHFPRSQRFCDLPLHFLTNEVGEFHKSIASVPLPPFVFYALLWSELLRLLL